MLRIVPAFSRRVANNCFMQAKGTENNDSVVEVNAVCDSRNMRSGLFYSQLNNRELFIACTVHDVMMEVCVSVFLDMKELNMCAVEKSCRENAATVLLNVYGDGVVASVRKAAVLDTELAGNQKLAQHLYRDCRDVMRTIVPKTEEV